MKKEIKLRIIKLHYGIDGFIKKGKQFNPVNKIPAAAATKNQLSKPILINQ